MSINLWNQLSNSKYNFNQSGGGYGVGSAGQPGGPQPPNPQPVATQPVATQPVPDPPLPPPPCCYDTLPQNSDLEASLDRLISAAEKNQYITVGNVTSSRLSGTTGAILVKVGSDIKFVIKYGGDNKLAKQGSKNKTKKRFHATQCEYFANCFYRIAGIEVPNMRKYTRTINTINYFIIVNEYIEGKELSEYRGESKENQNKIEENILKGFIMDCFLFNDDAVGYDLDNIRYTSELVPYRIDAGAAFLFTATGYIRYHWNSDGVKLLLNYSGIFPPYPDLKPHHRQIINLRDIISRTIRRKYGLDDQTHTLMEGDVLRKALQDIYPMQQLRDIFRKILHCVKYHRGEFDNLFADSIIQDSGTTYNHTNYLPVIRGRLENIYRFIWGGLVYDADSNKHIYKIMDGNLDLNFHRDSD